MGGKNGEEGWWAKNGRMARKDKKDKCEKRRERRDEDKAWRLKSSRKKGEEKG